MTGGRPEDAVVWVGRCASRGLAVLGLGIGLVLVGVGVVALGLAPGTPVPGWIAIAVGVLCLLSLVWASRVTVVVDSAALTVSWGRVRWPRRRFRWQQVGSVSAIRVDPLRWGGWGYRWIPWAHATAAVVRGGPAISLGLTSGDTFVVTVDDAVTGAKAAARARATALRQSPG